VESGEFQASPFECEAMGKFTGFRFDDCSRSTAELLHSHFAPSLIVRFSSFLMFFLSFPFPTFLAHSPALAVVLFDLRCTDVLERSFSLLSNAVEPTSVSGKQKKSAVFQFIAQIDVCSVNQWQNP
jgi:hypothetical protein